MLCQVGSAQIMCRLVGRVIQGQDEIAVRISKQFFDVNWVEEHVDPARHKCDLGGRARTEDASRAMDARIIGLVAVAPCSAGTFSGKHL